MGVSQDKMTSFTFVDETYDVRNIPEDIIIDHAFECVGGLGSTKAISQIIDYIRPEGTIAILGVSENDSGERSQNVRKQPLGQDRLYKYS